MSLPGHSLDEIDSAAYSTPRDSFLSVYRSCCANYGIKGYSSIVNRVEKQQGQVLDLVGTNLVGPALHAVFLAFAASQSIQQVLLDRLVLDDAAKTLLVEGLCKNNNITHLSLCGCGIDAVLGESIIESLMESDSPLTILKLRDNKLDANCGAVLAQALQSRLCYLEQLDISGNPMRDSGILPILRTLECNHRLSTLGLSRTSIGIKSAKAISELLQCNSSVTSITLDYNNIGRTTEERILNTLYHRKQAGKASEEKVQFESYSVSGGHSEVSSSVELQPENDKLRKTKLEWERGIESDPLEAWSTTVQGVMGTSAAAHVSAPLVSDMDKVLFRCVNKLQDYMVNLNEGDTTPLNNHEGSGNVLALQPFHTVVQSLLWCADAATLQADLLAAATEANEKLTERVKALVQESQQYKSARITQAKNSNALTRRNSVLETKISQLNKRNKKQEEQVQALQKQLEVLTKEHESCKQKLSLRQSGTQRVQQSCQDPGSKCMVANQEWRELELGKLESYNQQLREQLATSLRRNEDLEKRLKVKLGRVQQHALRKRRESLESSLREQVEGERAKVKLANERIGKLQAQLTQVLLQMRDSGGTLNDSRREAREAKQQAKDADERVFAAEGRVSRMSVELHSLERKVEEIEQERERQDQVFQSGKVELETCQARNYWLEEQLRELKHKQEKLQNSIVKLKMECETEESEHNRTKEHCSNMEAKVEQLSLALDDEKRLCSILVQEKADYEICTKELKAMLEQNSLKSRDNVKEADADQVFLDFPSENNDVHSKDGVEEVDVNKSSLDFLSEKNGVHSRDNVEEANGASSDFPSEKNGVHSRESVEEANVNKAPVEPPLKHLQTEYRCEDQVGEYSRLEAPAALAAAETARLAHERLIELTSLLQSKEDEIKELRKRVEMLEETIGSLEGQVTAEATEKQSVKLKLETIQSELAELNEEHEELIQMMVEKEAREFTTDDK